MLYVEDNEDDQYCNKRQYHEIFSKNNDRHKDSKYQRKHHSNKKMDYPLMLHKGDLVLVLKEYLFKFAAIIAVGKPPVDGFHILFQIFCHIYITALQI